LDANADSLIFRAFDRDKMRLYGSSDWTGSDRGRSLLSVLYGLYSRSNHETVPVHQRHLLFAALLYCKKGTATMTDEQTTIGAGAPRERPSTQRTIPTSGSDV